MRFLRSSVQFWFGIQALGLAVNALSIGVVWLFPQRFHAPQVGSEALATLVGASLVMAVLDGASVIAWWTLRSGKPSARLWAIAASFLNLPIPVLSNLRASNVLASFLHVPDWLIGTLIATAGVIAYSSTDSAPSRVPAAKPVRIAGDGTSTIKDYIGRAASFVIVWLSLGWWRTWATHHDLAFPDLIPFFGQMELAVLFTTLGHELGHLVAGWACGKRLRSFQVGPLGGSIRNGAWKFEFNMRKFYGGAVGMVAPDLTHMRSRKAFSLLGGPVASLVMGSFFIVATLLTPGHAWQQYWMFLSLLATFSISAFVVNLIPIKPESLYSDGAQLYQILTNGPWARVHFAFAMVSTSTVSPVRPRDFDINVIDKAALSVQQGERGLQLRLFACTHYLDANRIPEAIVSMQKAEALYDEAVFEKPQDICAEFVFVNAFYKHDLVSAEMWSRRIDDLPQVDPDADYWRAKTALHWLKEEHKEALAAWERGNALAQKLPSAGTYDFTRSCFAKMRVALDAPVQTARVAVEV